MLNRLRCAKLLFLLVVINELSSSNTSDDLQTDHRCFCQLRGQIDDCSCTVDTVDHFNNVKIHPVLNSLLSKNYFRFFKVNLDRPCPFWADDGRCSIRDCSVQACSEEEIPEGLKQSHADHQQLNKYSENAQELDECETEIELSHLDTSISDETQKEFAKWKAHDDAQENFCEMDDENSLGMRYVDLLLNPERYTGYKGDSAHRIWISIYEENCFKPQSGYGQYLDSRTIGGLCLEKRAFYRAISGLHASINVHLCANYLMGDKSGFGAIGASHWGENVEEFQNRFSPEYTQGEGPSRLKNLYFIYLLELRAIAKATPYLLNEKYYTGNEEEDTEVLKAMQEVLKKVKSFPDHFSESVMFAGNKKEAKALKEEFRQHFLNISRIMDCVGCDKCRLWGKLQVQGLGTALKILFSGDQTGEEFSLDEMKKAKFQLTRNEIVSLLNAFGRISNSIYALERFRDLLRKPMRTSHDN